MKEKLSNLWSVLTRSELWITVAVILGALQSQNLFPEDSTWAKLICVGLAVLTALGYGTMRTVRKIKRDYGG